MYDWANSAYITVFGAVIGAFFTGSIVPGDEYWGLSRREPCSASSSGLDRFCSCWRCRSSAPWPTTPGRSAATCATSPCWARVFTLLAAFIPEGQVPLFLFVVLVSQFGFVAANVFYDGFLPDIATDDTIDAVSSKGFAYGYLGGGLWLLLALLLITLSSDEAGATLTETLAARISIFGSGVWWVGFSIISLRRLPADDADGNGRPQSESPSTHPIGFARTLSTTRQLRAFPQLLLFVVAFVLYNSGNRDRDRRVRTICRGHARVSSCRRSPWPFSSCSSSRSSVRCCSVRSPNASDRSGPCSSPSWCGHGLAVVAFFLPEGSSAGFLGLGAVVGFVLGGVQALSRSLYGTDDPRGGVGRVLRVLLGVLEAVAVIGPLLFGLDQRRHRLGETADPCPSLHSS